MNASIAASAVRMTGRERCTVASTTASNRANPSFSLWRIWPIKMSVLRLRIPESATRPTRALMPNGCWNMSKVGITPVRPQGAGANTMVIARIEPGVSGRARRDLYRTDVFADLGDRDAAQQELHLLSCVAGRQPDALQPVLIERKTKRGYALAPIGVGRSHQGAGLHHAAYLRRNVTKLIGVGPHHTESHREGRGRPEHDLRNPHASLRRQPFGRRVSQPPFERLACLFAWRQYDDLRERGIRQ